MQLSGDVPAISAAVSRIGHRAVGAARAHEAVQHKQYMLVLSAETARLYHEKERR
jgi:hypothetical protein